MDIKIRKKSHDKARKKSGEAASTIAFLLLNAFLPSMLGPTRRSAVFSAEENGASQPKEANENLEVIQWP